MRIVVSAEALADLQRLREFLAEESPQAAQRAAVVLETAISSLETFPMRGRVIAGPDLREIVVAFGRSGYLVRYAHRAEQDEIVIVRVWHGREGRG